MRLRTFDSIMWLSENLAYNAMAADIEGKTDWWFSVQNTKIITLEGAQKYETKQSQNFIASTVSCFDNLLSELGYKKCSNGYKITSTNYNRIAFFCHDGISKILLSYALLIPFHIFCASFSIPHTGVTVMDFAVTNDKLISFRNPKCSGKSLTYFFAARKYFLSSSYNVMATI